MQRDSINFESSEIGVLFRKMLIPTLLGALAMSAMTVVDGIIVGQGVGSVGVAAINIVAPIYLLMSGIGLMIGAGCSVVASIHLAQNKLKVARLNVTQALLASASLVALIAVVVLAFPRQTAQLLGASSTLMPHVLDYVMWIMPGFVFEMFSLIGLFVIRLDGAPRYAMWCNIIPAVLNAILDWVLVFPVGMGVEGAGLATSFCMVLGGLMALGYLLFKANKLHLELPKLSLKSLRLTLRNIGYQCRIGFSSLMGELAVAISIYIGNLVFMRYLGDDGVGAFGISCYYTPFFFSVGNSIAQSAQPIISYNYGAERWTNVARVRRLLFGTSFSVGVVLALLFALLPVPLVALFVDAGSAAGQIAINGFPYFSTGIIFFILNVSIIGYYQSIERIGRAILFVCLRGLIFLLPCFVLLPRLYGEAGMWLAMPVAELLTLLSIVISGRIDAARNSR
ncbi:MAG: MATE family efflux transporter [Alistipes sp.]|nr:MATE family efflux transporter [Alistipes sp.]